MNIILIGAFVLILLLILTLSSTPFIFSINWCFKKKLSLKLFFKIIIFNLFFVTIFLLTRVFASSYSFLLSYYLGLVTFMFGIGTIFALILGLFALFKKSFILRQNFFGYILISIIIVMSLISIYNFEKPFEVEEFEIISNKVSKEYKFVLLADSQFGSVKFDYSKEIASRINGLNPDFIIFPGDAIDNEDFSYDNLKPLNFNAPIYFSRGNHEFYHELERLQEILNDLGFITLIDEKIVFEDFEIVGIDYSDTPKHLIEELEKIKPSGDKFSILSYHHPGHLNYTLNRGFDLVLSGHSHAGQIWPITWIVDLLFEFGDGYFIFGETHLYTTDGVGLWGPRMRLDSQNEIAVFTIKPTLKN